MHDAPVGKRPGRKAYKPSASARERVMTYIAAGMTLPQIADALVISRTTLCKCFVAELAAGRAKRMAALCPPALLSSYRNGLLWPQPSGEKSAALM